MDLMPVVMDPQNFVGSQNEAKVEKVERDLKKLIDSSKQINHDPMLTKRDPTLRFVAAAFNEDLRRAQEAFAMGKREYARYTLMNVTSYCIECHTRTSSGPSFQTPEIEKALTGLGGLERGEYLLATRQFDRALMEFEKIMKSELSEDGNLFQLDRAVRYSLAVSIKFLKSPQKALSIVKAVENAPKAPYYLKQSARSWESAINSWIAEKPATSSSGAVLLANSRRLVDQGRLLTGASADRGGDVHFLRALSDLHLVLSVPQKADILGEALYLMGVAYENVRDLSVWSLHENYFESCIRQVPGTRWSSQCYRRLEESVLAGFTGSSGTRLPMDAQLRLSELKKLALSSSRPAPSER